MSKSWYHLVDFMVHGKRAGDDEKELARQGYLPRAAEGILRQLKVFRLSQGTAPRAVTKVMTNACFRQQNWEDEEMHRVLNTAVVPAGSRVTHGSSDFSATVRLSSL